MRSFVHITLNLPTTCLLYYLLAGAPTFAADKSPEWVGQVVSTTGVVFVRPEEGQSRSGRRSAKPGDQVFPGDIINTSSNGGAKILFRDKSVIDIGASALFKVQKFDKAGRDDRKVEMELSYGSVRAAVTRKIRGRGTFQLRTRSATMGVRGTIVYGQADSGGADSVGKSSFMITQGQGVVTSNLGAGAPPIVLNAGDVSTSSDSARPMEKVTLSGMALNQKLGEVHNLNRSSDTAFANATNFDNAMAEKRQRNSEKEEEQKRKSELADSSDGKSGAKAGSENAADPESAKGKEDSKEGGKEEKKADSSATASASPSSDAATGSGGEGDSNKNPKEDSGAPQTADSASSAGSKQDPAAAGSDSGGDRSVASAPASEPAAPSLSMLDNIATTVVDAAPPPPQLTPTDVGIAGAPNLNTVLEQQAASPVNTGPTSGRISVSVTFK